MTHTPPPPSISAHFIGSIEGNRQDYLAIEQVLIAHQWTLITRHSLERELHAIEHETFRESQEYVRQSQEWIQRADIIIIEATTPVLGTGFELAYAVSKAKPIIVMYRPNELNEPHVLKGYDSNKIYLVPYTSTTLKRELEHAMKQAIQHVDARLHIMLTQKQLQYLTWIAEQKKVPRSSYIRSLIDADAKNNADYNG